MAKMGVETAWSDTSGFEVKPLFEAPCAKKCRGTGETAATRVTEKAHRKNIDVYSGASILPPKHGIPDLPLTFYYVKC